MTNSLTNPPAFDPHIDQTYGALREALTEVLIAARGKITFPQDLARHLELDKSLAWRVSRVVEAPSPAEGVPYLPGEPGLKRFLAAAERRGASRAQAEAVEGAHAAFRAMVDLHAGDQATFELLMDAHADDEEQVLLQSRRLAYRGNAGVWGVRADLKLSTFFVAPNRDDSSTIDTLLIGGFRGLCRLRPTTGWPLFRIRSYSSSASAAEVGGAAVAPIGPPESADLGLLDAFSEGSEISMRVDRDPLGLVYRLGEGRVGRTGAFSCFFARRTAGSFARYRTPEDDSGEFSSLIEVPVEALLFDLFVHRDLPYGERLSYSVFGRPGGGLDDHTVAGARVRLPISVHPDRLPPEPGAHETDLVPRYSELLAHAVEPTGWSMDEFVCHRYLTPFPPFRSTVMLSFPLDEAAE